MVVLWSHKCWSPFNDIKHQFVTSKFYFRKIHFNKYHLSKILQIYEKMHSFVFTAICYNELYGQKYFRPNDYNFPDGFKIISRPITLHYSRFCKDITFFIILNKYPPEAFILTCISYLFSLEHCITGLGWCIPKVSFRSTISCSRTLDGAAHA